MLIDMRGEVHNNLTVLEFAYVSENMGAYWKCRCKCGRIKDIPGANIRNGHAKSCGCLRDKQAAINSKMKKFIRRIDY